MIKATACFTLALILFGAGIFCAAQASNQFLAAIARKKASGGGSTLRTDLVAWWSFDEASGNALDEHDDHDGVETGGTIARATGKQGNAADIEAGDAEYFAVSDHADFVQGGTNPLTINFWFNAETRVGGSGFFSQGTELISRIDTDDVEIILNSFTTNDRVVSTGNVLPAATWAMWTLVYRASGDIEVYKNGGLNNNITPTGTWADDSSDFDIGRFGASYSDGLFDEMAYWNRDLTTEEITELYNSGSGISYSDTAP